MIASESAPDQVSTIAAGACGLPVAVEVVRRLSRSGRWSVPAWEAVSVVCGSGVSTTAVPRELPAIADETSRYLIGGLKLSLYVDGCESYWYNLQSDQPRLFVVCFLEDEADSEGGLGLTPALVTASQDEANAHMESDDPVFAVPMPALVIDMVERFVVEHYAPEIKKKRKRREWSQETQFGARRGRQPGGEASR